MNWDQVVGNWKQLKGNVKQQWAKLTDDDLDLINGKREELAGKIQAAYGVSKEEAEQQLDDWQNKQQNNLVNSDDELEDDTRRTDNTLHTSKYGYDDNSNTPRNMQDGKGASSGDGLGNGPGDGAGLPGGDESDDMDDLNNPSPNPMPDDLDEPTHANDGETPHEDKSIDQT